MKVKLYKGDCLEVMKRFKRNFFDSVITDPPYGLRFMGQDWDDVIPSVEYWKEMLRVSKPGATLFSFGGTRTHHRLMCNIEDAGWQIKDCLCWLFGSGMPKSFNIGKKDKKFDGYGTCLKPAYEPIIFAMKKMDGSYNENGKKWGVAGLNIDGCRVPTEGEDKEKHQREWDRFQSKNARGNTAGNMGLNEVDLSSYVKDGRFPANLMHDGICKGEESRFFYCAKVSTKERQGYNDHPTLKPIKLMEYLCRLSRTPEGGRVLDPFMGSGTTGIACLKTNRSFFGIEKELEYFETAKKRIGRKTNDSNL